MQPTRPTGHGGPEATWDKRSADHTFIRRGKAEFAAIPYESVDYAVMEHCAGSSFPIKLVPLDNVWNGLGAWDAIWNVTPKDEAGNAQIGDVLTTDSENTLVHATSRLICLVGIDNLIVVETPDAPLVANKNRSQSVKFLVTQLQKTNHQERTLHRKVHLPWAWYNSIDKGGRFEVKRIQVKLKDSLNL